MQDVKKNNNVKSLFISMVACAVGLGLSLFACAYVWFAPPPVFNIGMPSLDIEPEEYYLGKVGEGQFTASFDLKNISDKPITIISAVGGCECTTISLPVTLIQPHKQVTMTCTLDTTGKKDMYKGLIVVGYVCQDVSDVKEEVTITPYYRRAVLAANIVLDAEVTKP